MHSTCLPACSVELCVCGWIERSRSIPCLACCHGIAQGVECMLWLNCIVVGQDPIQGNSLQEVKGIDRCVVSKLPHLHTLLYPHQWCASVHSTSAYLVIVRKQRVWRQSPWRQDELTTKISCAIQLGNWMLQQLCACHRFVYCVCVCVCGCLLG